MPLKVLMDHIDDPKTGKDRLMTYADCKGDGDDWVDAAKFLPYDFDLVLLRTDQDKTLPGWISASHWDGYRVTSDHKVLFWKRQYGNAV